MKSRQRVTAAPITLAAAVLVMLSLPTAAFGQEWTPDELRFQRLFIGLTKGNLQESHLKSYATLEALARRLQERIAKDTISAVHLGDLKPWSDLNAPSQREMLARRNYTHYIIAIPRAQVSGVVNVTWRVGKVRPPQHRPREWNLRYETTITIPPADQNAAVILERKNEKSDVDEADHLETQLHGVIPEIKPSRQYAIECIHDDAAVGEKIRLETMEWLSVELEVPRWKPYGGDRLTSTVAKKRCDEGAMKKDELDLLVGGRLELWEKDAERVLASIHLTNIAWQRERLARSAYQSEDDDDDEPLKLRDFCFWTRDPPIRWVGDLAGYIQSQGLKIKRAKKYNIRFRCPQ